MGSPFTKTGTISVAVDGDRRLEDVMARVLAALQQQKARDLKVTSNTIVFRGRPLRWVTGWNVLSAISSGEIIFAESVGTITLNYRLSWLGLFLLTTGIATAAVALSRDVNLRFVLPLAWLFSLFLTYTKVGAGFREFLSRAAGGLSTNDVRIGDPFPDY